MTLWNEWKETTQKHRKGTYERRTNLFIVSLEFIQTKLDEALENLKHESNERKDLSTKVQLLIQENQKLQKQVKNCE